MNWMTGPSSPPHSWLLSITGATQILHVLTIGDMIMDTVIATLDDGKVLPCIAYIVREVLECNVTESEYRQMRAYVKECDAWFGGMDSILAWTILVRLDRSFRDDDVLLWRSKDAVLRRARLFYTGLCDEWRLYANTWNDTQAIYMRKYIKSVLDFGNMVNIEDDLHPY